MENDVRFGKAADQPLRPQVINDGQLFSLRCRKHFESFADPLKPGNPRKVFVHDISGNHPCLKFRFIKEPFDGMK